MTDLLTDLSTISDDNFRIQNQKLMLTYKTHLDKDEFTAWLRSKCPIKTIYIAHENGVGDEITPYEHTHVVVNFVKAFQGRNSRVLDYQGIHPNISKIKEPEDWKKACRYICKEDKSIVLKSEDTFNEVTSIWGHRSLAEALENCSLRDAVSTIAVYGAKPMPLPEPEITEEEFYEWQANLWIELQKSPDGRRIKWLFDLVGNTGKTRFAKWCCLEHSSKCVMLNNIGKVSDFAMNMQTFWNQGWRGDTVFLNLSRSYADKQQLYEAMEIIADGYITCTKYTGGVVWLPPLHVVVLANFEPQYDKLSLDRWDIYTISEAKALVRRAPVTLIGAREKGHQYFGK